MEAEILFEQIRQKLDSMNLKRTPPKRKGKTPKYATSAVQSINPSIDGLTGKTGKSHFVV